MARRGLALPGARPPLRLLSPAGWFGLALAPALLSPLVPGQQFGPEFAVGAGIWLGVCVPLFAGYLHFGQSMSDGRTRFDGETVSVVTILGRRSVALSDVVYVAARSGTSTANYSEYVALRDSDGRWLTLYCRHGLPPGGASDVQRVADRLRADVAAGRITASERARILLGLERVPLARRMWLTAITFGWGVLAIAVFWALLAFTFGYYMAVTGASLS